MSTKGHLDRCGRPEWERPIGRLRLGPILVLVISAEAVVLHAVIGLGLPAIWGGDGIGYHRLAVNLIDHRSFSLDESPPYRPDVFRAPGYPAFIALAYGIGGRSYAAPRMAQLALLAATAWLVSVLAARFVDRRAAAAASILCATYPPFVFGTMDHLTETLATFLVVLLVLLLKMGMDDPKGGHRWMILAGLDASICSLVRPTLSLLIVPAIGGIILAEPALTFRRRIALSGLALAGLFFGSLPWAARNAALTGEFIPYAESGKGYSLFLSAQQYGGRLSHRLSGPEWRSADEELAHRSRTPGRPISSAGRGGGQGHEAVLRDDRACVALAIEDFRGLTPLQVSRGLFVRLGYLWMATDLPAWEPGLLHLLVQALHGVLAALTLLGCWLCRARLMGHWVLWIVPAYLTLTHLVFHAEGRYTLPARPFLLIYAGVALGWLWGALRSGSDPREGAGRPR